MEVPKKSNLDVIPEEKSGSNTEASTPSTADQVTTPEFQLDSPMRRRLSDETTRCPSAGPPSTITLNEDTSSFSSRTKMTGGTDCVVCSSNISSDTPLEIITNLKTALYNMIVRLNTGTPFSTLNFPLLRNDFPYLLHTLTVRGLVSSEVFTDLADTEIGLLYHVHHQLSSSGMLPVPLPERTFALANHRVPRLETKLVALGPSVRYLGECPMKKKKKKKSNVSFAVTTTTTTTVTSTSTTASEVPATPAVSELPAIDEQIICHRSCELCDQEVCTHMYRCTCTHRIQDGCIHYHVALQEAGERGSAAAGTVRKLRPENTVFVHLSARVMEKLHVRGMCYDRDEDVVRLDDNVFGVRRLYHVDQVEYDESQGQGDKDENEDDADVVTATDIMVRVERKTQPSTPAGWGMQYICPVCPRYRRCPECKICRHSFVCQCSHYQQKGLLCEHCHAVAMHLSIHKDRMLAKPIFEYESDDSGDESLISEMLLRRGSNTSQQEVEGYRSRRSRVRRPCSLIDVQQMDQQVEDDEQHPDEEEVLGLSLGDDVFVQELVYAYHEMSHGIRANRIEQISDEMWIVIDNKRQNFFTVKKNSAMACLCDTTTIRPVARCLECGICYNDYTCSCFVPTPIICKHIHAVHLKMFPSGWERLNCEDRRVSALVHFLGQHDE